jgi:hypothetical protein
VGAVKRRLSENLKKETARFAALIAKRAFCL